jgi:hypothetical protein
VELEADGRAIAVPKLLQWYAVDFGGKGGVPEFALQHLDEAPVERAERHLGHLKLRYVAFDWRLHRR